MSRDDGEVAVLRLRWEEAGKKLASNAPEVFRELLAQAEISARIFQGFGEDITPTINGT